ncbi:MAG: sulfite exporter TauE/SafE family protein [Planctomycetes bacterium]|nr:sulfite exporter TauE/SafE family protein [Planctomycetota bacterium]
MSPVEFTASVFGIALTAGLIGSLLGVGGGIVVVPGLALLLGVDVHLAIGASLVGVVATSTGAAAAYVRDGLANLRLAMLLEVATVAGALAGAVLANRFDQHVLFMIFGGLLVYASAAMFITQIRAKTDKPVPHDALADRLRLSGMYHDKATGKDVHYRATRTWLGLSVSLVAGLISGLLGVGGGILKVPTMHLGMRLPIKVSTATSNLMMGVTAAAGAGVFFARGQVAPLIAAPVAAGVLIGATAGSRFLPRIHSAWIRGAFTVLMVYVAFEMLRKGIK